MAVSRDLRPDSFAGLAVDWAPLDHAAGDPVMIGDLVSAGIDDLPVYRVMALEEDRAWVVTHPGAPQRMMWLAAIRWRGVERPDWEPSKAGRSVGGMGPP